MACVGMLRLNGEGREACIEVHLVSDAPQQQQPAPSSILIFSNYPHQLTTTRQSSILANFNV